MGQLSFPPIGDTLLLLLLFIWTLDELVALLRWLPLSVGALSQSS